MSALCCFGAGGHGRVVASQWRARRNREVVFADEGVAVGSRVHGIPVKFAGLADIVGHAVLITIGDNRTRATAQERAQQLGLPLATFVADTRNYFARPPGPGTMIMAGAVVNVGARIGQGVIVNTLAVIEHDCTIGDFAHVSPGALVAGGCEIGEGAWIGAGAVVVPQLAIAPGAVVGAGSVVIRNISEAGVYVGAPARRIR